MSYLQLSSGIPNFSKAIISFWFRIPASTFAIMSAISDTPPPDRQTDHMCDLCYSPELYKIIPLITFGSLEFDSDGNRCQPSFVGVDCFGGVNCLAVNLQTPVFSSWITETPPASYRPECFYMSGYASPNDQNTTVSADSWHHALISFDISGAGSAVYGATDFTLSSESAFTWALDDVARMNISINPSGGGRWADNGISDPKIIISQGLIDYAGAPGSTVSFSGGYISANDKPVGIPSSTDFVNKVQMVEMADLQFFTGISVDASSIDVRRLFIDADGGPVNPSVAAAELGQAPKIVLHGSDNWMNGVNTGTLGPFTPTGTINPFGESPIL
jgi:hypothetical protein